MRNIVQENLSGTAYDISSIPFSAVEFDHSGSYLAVAGSDIRYAFNAGHILPCVFIWSVLGGWLSIEHGYFKKPVVTE